MVTKFSHIVYKSGKGRESLTLPTIQSITVPDSSSIPSHPTITGEFRQQFTASKAPKVSFTMWLENGNYVGSTIDTSKVIRILDDIKTNRYSFNLTTSHSGEESRFLNDLVIEAITYTRSTTNRDRVVVTVACTKLKMVELEWKMVDSTDIFGYNIFGTGSSGPSVQQVSFTPVLADSEFSLGQSSWDKRITASKRGLSGDMRMPVPEQVGEYIEEELSSHEGSFVYKLTQQLDMNAGNKVYKGTASFPTKFSSSTQYNVKFAEIEFEVKVNELCGLQHELPLSLVWPEYDGYSSEKTMDYEDIDRSTNPKHVYNFANTYPAFAPSKSFEYVANIEELADFVQKNNNQFVYDLNMVGNGAIVRNQHYIAVYPIEDKYSCTVSCGDGFSHDVKPSGSLDIRHFKVTTGSHGFKIDAGTDEMQNEWDDYFKGAGSQPHYEMNVIVVTLGTMIQIYLTAPSILNQGMVSYNA